MAWNLNNNDNEYDLFNSQTDEMIDMFGLVIKYVKTEGVNLDEIFGEYTHKYIKQDSLIEMSVLPENSEELEQLGNTFGKFGFLNTEMFNFYISKTTADKLNYSNIESMAVGDIAVLPNGKKFEITFVENEVNGTNNMFPYTNEKNVYLLKAKLWSYNSDEKEKPTTVVDENGDEQIKDTLNDFDFSGLDEIFNNSENLVEEVTDDVTNEVTTTKIDNKRLKVQKEEVEKIDIVKGDVFGEWD